MKTTLTLAAVLVGTAAVSPARDLYVSTRGSDSAGGTKRAPFASIQKAADVAQPGDTCFIESGVYPESVKVLSSGTADKPIVFRPASKTGHVVLTGADPIPSNHWKQIDQHRYKCSIDLSLGSGNQLFLNEEPLFEARWPNIGKDLLAPELAVMDAGTTPKQIVDAELPDYDFSEGFVWVHAPKYWENWTSKILKQDATSLHIKNKAPFQGPNQHVAAQNAEYFVFGILDALDADNEWYYDDRMQELVVFRADGVLPEEPYWVKKRMSALDVSDARHLEFYNITVMGAAILTDSSTEHILFNRITVYFPYYDSLGKNLKHNGFVLNGRNNIVQNSEISYASGPCITLDGKNNRLLNCYIHDGNLFGGFVGCVLLRGKGNIISHCTISRSGRTLINYSGMYQSLIQHCDLSHAGMLTSDLGLTYGTNIEGGNSEVRYNLMHENHGQDKTKNMGLYYDHGTKNVITHHNIVWGADYAGLLINHYANGHLIYNNTFIAETYGFRSVWGNQYAPDLLNSRFINNLFAGTFSTTAENYFATNNIIGYEGFNPAQPMKGYAAGYGKGLPIPGITHTTPGIGAIEYEGMTFKAGHDFENPPSYDFTRSLPPHRNLLQNAAFEHEDHFYPWQSKGEATPITHKPQYHNHKDTNLGRMGSHSVELTGKVGELFQQVSGLKPFAAYEFICQLRVADNEKASIGVRFPDGSEKFSPPVTTGAPGWTRCRLTFDVPENTETAEVFVRRLTDGSNKTVHVDDLSLTLK